MQNEEIVTATNWLMTRIPSGIDESEVQMALDFMMELVNRCPVPILFDDIIHSAPLEVLIIPPATMDADTRNVDDLINGRTLSHQTIDAIAESLHNHMQDEGQRILEISLPNEATIVIYPPEDRQTILIAHSVHVFAGHSAHETRH
jgi:hypothetical protein